jgi:hypothetical protein
MEVFSQLNLDFLCEAVSDRFDELSLHAKPYGR